MNNQSWLFVGIYHPTKKNSDPGDKKSRNLEKSRILGIKIPRLRKIPNPGDSQKIPRIFKKSRKNREGQKTVKTQNF